jgi:hypothetical protein
VVPGRCPRLVTDPLHVAAPARDGRGPRTSRRRRGEEYLLERRLFRRRSTGEVANPEFLELAFPPRYHYDGTDRVEISGGDETVVERKVKLPLRWLKDFVEVQAYQSRLSRSQ